VFKKFRKKTKFIYSFRLDSSCNRQTISCSMFYLYILSKKSWWTIIYCWLDHANILYRMFSWEICTTMLCLSSTYFTE